MTWDSAMLHVFNGKWQHSYECLSSVGLYLPVLYFVPRFLTFDIFAVINSFRCQVFLPNWHIDNPLPTQLMCKNCVLSTTSNHHISKLPSALVSFFVFFLFLAAICISTVNPHRCQMFQRVTPAIKQMKKCQGWSHIDKQQLFRCAQMSQNCFFCSIQNKSLSFYIIYKMHLIYLNV